MGTLARSRIAFLKLEGITQDPKAFSAISHRVLFK
jgi:hypothetical protein